MLEYRMMAAILFGTIEVYMLTYSQTYKVYEKTHNSDPNIDVPIDPYVLLGQ